MIQNSVKTGSAPRVHLKGVSLTCSEILTAIIIAYKSLRKFNYTRVFVEEMCRTAHGRGEFNGPASPITARGEILRLAFLFFTPPPERPRESREQDKPRPSISARCPRNTNLL